MCFYTMLYGRFSTYSRKDTAHPANRCNITFSVNILGYILYRIFYAKASQGLKHEPNLNNRKAQTL